MDETQGIAPRWHLLRMVGGGHQPQPGERVALEELEDRGMVENWTTGRWQATGLGRRTLGQVFGPADVPAPREGHHGEPTEARSSSRATGVAAPR